MTASQKTSFHTGFNEGAGHMDRRDGQGGDWRPEREERRDRGVGGVLCLKEMGKGREGE